MITKWRPSAILALGIATWNGQAQGTFHNFGFESASVVPIQGAPYPQQIDFTSAFPGWTGHTGTTLESSALYNTQFLDSSGIDLIDKSYNSGAWVSRGNYAVMLQAEFSLYSEPLEPADTMLSQNGLVPAGSQSLLFEARMLSPQSADSFEVRLGGQTLSLSPVSIFGNFTVYGADVRAWAGQTAQLDFVVHSPAPMMAAVLLDGIRFSAQPIPEPSVLGLVGLGGLLVGFRFRSRS
jgi:hypothetical protein